MTRAELQRWRHSHRGKVGAGASSKEGDTDSAVSLPIAPTQDTVESGALLSTEQLAVRPEDALAPEAVATAAVAAIPSTPPPGDDDIPAFLDRRPLSADNQREYDAIEATWKSHVLPLWNRASAVVRERIIAEVIRANPSGHVPGGATPKVAVQRKNLGPKKVVWDDEMPF